MPRESKRPGKEILLSSGVTVIVKPFPAGLWNDIQVEALRRFPEPAPPKRTIKVVDGTEEVDDLSNPEHIAAVANAENERNALVGKAVLEWCVHLKHPDKWRSAEERLERYGQKLPEDAEDRRMVFLEKYAFRTADDWEAASIAAVSQMLIRDEEVAARVAFFQSDMEGPAADDPDAQGVTGG